MPNTTVKSPYSGQPVTVRTEDAGRAIKDSDGKVFFLIKDESSQEWYGSRTRSGSLEELAYVKTLEVSPFNLQQPVIRTGTPRKKSLKSSALLLIVSAILGVGFGFAYVKYIKPAMTHAEPTPNQPTEQS